MIFDAPSRMTIRGQPTMAQINRQRSQRLAREGMRAETSVPRLAYRD
jgi:hypothetical protein